MEDPSGEVWPPLAGSAPQRHDAAAGIRLAGIAFAISLAATIVAAAALVVAYEAPHPDAQQTVAVLATSLAFGITTRGWRRRTSLKKAEQAAKAAAGFAGTVDGTAASGAPQVTCPQCGAESTLAAEFCPGCGAPLSYQHPVVAWGPFGLPGQWTWPGYSGRKIPDLASAGLAVVAALVAVIVAHPPARSADQLTYDQLRAGDCLAGSNMGLGTAAMWPDYVTQVACAKPHEVEIFFAGNIWPQSLAYPGATAVGNAADARCAAAFTAYDGVDSTNTVFRHTAIIPDSSSDWASGDRLLVCLAYEPSNWGPSGGTPLDYSIKGSHQ